MRQKVALGIAVCVVFGVVNSVHAQPPFGKGGFRPPPDPIAVALDIDKNGEISAIELQGAPAALLSLDKNKDGKLTRDEFLPRFAGKGFPPKGKGFPPKGKGGFGRRLPPMVQALDKDRNGEISTAEMKNSVAALKTLDKNNDGKLVASEFQPRFGPPGGMMRQRLELVAKFDTDKNGRLDAEERKKAREHVKKNRGAGGGRPARFAGGPEPKPGPKVAPAEVKNFPQKMLYDPAIIRTIFFEFASEDWEAEMADFYRTDVDVPAKMTVDGKSFGEVGLRFRGNSSFFTVGAGQKRSFNLSVDYLDKKLRLYGYKTLNLLNLHADPSMLREVMFSHIARHYIPAMKANYVKVVINGRSWGIYANVQQFNKEFLRDNFGTTKGVRWKVPPGFRGPGALVFSSDKKEDYDQSFQIKSKDRPEAWRDLMRLCKALKDTPPEEAEKKLDAILNIDRALWFLAIDNVFIDGDGYFSRGSDYVIYQDGKYGRFHLLPSDSNETFRYSGAGGPGFRPSGPPGATLDPLSQIDAENRPVISVLLSNPRLKARYVAHIRTIVNEWLDWKKIGPIATQLHDMLDPEVKVDTRKLYPYESFVTNLLKPAQGGFRSTTGFKQFVDERRAFLLNHPLLKTKAPEIQSLSLKMENGRARVEAKISGEVPVSDVILYYATAPLAPFENVPMQPTKSGKGVYVAQISKLIPGTMLRYYVEARADRKSGTTAFKPSRTEFGARTYKVPAINGNFGVMLNEVMSNNTTAVKDPQGEYDDWIELYNPTDKVINLSGMYLSDSKKDLRKWKLPAGTTIASKGFLVIWADEDGRAKPGLHANFRLSKNGETVYLVDTDARGNTILDAVSLEKQPANTSYGRIANGGTRWEVLTPTPGAVNKRSME